MYALVDCNNFYASCERVFRPDLNGKPIVVLSNNDGCIIARSNEAKALDIPMGAPYFKFKDLLAKHKVQVFSSNYALYGDFSSRVMQILTQFAPEIEVYSIDEAFLKLENFSYLDLKAHGIKIKQTIQKWLGIPVSIGFAPTKALSKTANKIAKKFPQQTKGVYVIDNEEKRLKALKWQKIEDVWGIGRKNTKKLNKMGVLNALQFTELNDNWMRKNMSVVGLRLKKELEGKPTLNLEEVKSKKNIATTRSFEMNYKDYDNVKERVITFAVVCAQKLRKQKSLCQTLMVFIHTNGFKKEVPQYAQNILVKLPFATNSSIDLAKHAEIGLRKIFKEGYAYKKAGVIVMDFVPENEKQACLFEDVNPKHKALMQAMDNINQKLGTQKLKLASQDLKRTWKMNQNLLSPHYTTNFKEIFIIKTI